MEVPAHTRDLRPALKYGKAKTPPKWRTQEWHLSDAARAPSQPAQIHMQGRASCCSACETRAARSSRACEPASGRLLGTQIKPPDWPSEAPMAPQKASPGARLSLSSLSRHQLAAELLRRLSWLPLPRADWRQTLGCWLDGGGSCMVHGNPSNGDEEAVR